MEWVDQNEKILDGRGWGTVAVTALYSNPQMESTMNIVAECFSFEETTMLQGVSVLLSVSAKEWQYQDILIDLDD